MFKEISNRGSGNIWNLKRFVEANALEFEALLNFITLFKFESVIFIGKAPCSSFKYSSFPIESIIYEEGIISHFASRGGIYDATTFAEGHPGGADKLLQAAGGPLEPFWAFYPVHHKPEVLELLAPMLIGKLHPDDVKAQEEAAAKATQRIWANEPQRSPLLQVVNQRPFNAEVPGHLLMQNYLTPNDIFFVRHHLPVPAMDISTYKVELSTEFPMPPAWWELSSFWSKQVTKTTLTLDDIKQLPHREVVAAMQCSGNRRSEMHTTKQVKGLMWKGGAVSNARWTGVPLAIVLKRAGILDVEAIEHALLDSPKQSAAEKKRTQQLRALLKKHIHLIGHDKDSQTNTVCRPEVFGFLDIWVTDKIPHGKSPR